MKPIVVVGSINMDLVTRSERAPRAGETVAGTAFATYHGGKGANQAVAAARLGAPALMIGCVGADAFGRELRDGLQGAGVDVTGVATHAGASGVASIHVDGQSENRIVVVPGTNAMLSEAMLHEQRALLQNAGLVLTQLETPLPTVRALAVLCEQHGVPLMLDPAPASALEAELLQRVHWLTPNLSEACVLLERPVLRESEVDHTTAFDLADDLLRLGPKAVLLKLGAAGLAFVSRTERIFVPSFPVRVVDTTAAGDACNAAFAVAYLQQHKTQEAVRSAAASGALCTTHEGAQPSLPTASQLGAFLMEFKS